jgi:hypothetical protein
MSEISPEVRSWSYLASYDYSTPILGTYHSSDLPRLYYELPSFNASNSGIIVDNLRQEQYEFLKKHESELKL